MRAVLLLHAILRVGVHLARPVAHAAAKHAACIRRTHGGLNAGTRAEKAGIIIFALVSGPAGRDGAAGAMWAQWIRSQVLEGATRNAAMTAPCKTCQGASGRKCAVVAHVRSPAARVNSVALAHHARQAASAHMLACLGRAHNALRRLAAGHACCCQLARRRPQCGRK